MTDFSGRPTGRSRDNPLYSDHVLFAMYLDALTVVLRKPEIRQACHEFGVSPATIRMRMMSKAAAVLGAATPEWDAYRQAAAAELTAASTDAAQVTHGSTWDPRDLMRTLVKVGCVSGVLMTVCGAVSSAFWAPMAALAQAGVTLLVVVALVWVMPRFLGGGDYFQSLGVTQRGNIDLDFIRSQLMTAVSETEVLAQVRTLINDARQDRFGHLYSVAGAPGLSEVYDIANLIPTKVAAEMDELLARFDGASIGVAGPRGAGKSTLVRQYCDEVPGDDSMYDYSAHDEDDLDYTILGWLFRDIEPDREPGELRCFVAAPVDYVARDFVLHLFATFCRTVIGEYGRQSRQSRYFPLRVKVLIWLNWAVQLLMALLWRAVVCNAAVLALLHWKHSIAWNLSVPARWVEYAALVAVCIGALDFIRLAAVRIRRRVREIRGGGGEHAIAIAARQHLGRVRYLQTYTSGWSGTLQLPWSNAAAQYSRSLGQAEQPQSYPEIVDEFRNFARTVAAETHRRNSRVFIGIDELDKIGSADQAEQFLNEIKGIFGIPHVYFLVSVSDDALNAFERRGLPLRNAFDSSFDEIMYIGPLSYDESRRLLYRRVIGLSEPFVALCHCLAGGLARDVIRAARQVVRVAVAIGRVDPPPISAEEAELSGIKDSAAYLLFQHNPEQAPPALAVIAAAVIRDDLLRKLRAVSSGIASTSPASAAGLHDTLYQIRQTLMLGQPVIHTVDLMTVACPGEPAELTSLRLDFAAYAYYCATLREVFTDQLDRERMIAATSVPPGPGSFDALANARGAFSLDTQLAWRLITQFRKAWSLETRDPAPAFAAESASDTQKP
jgi:KAP family P-loop domain